MNVLYHHKRAFVFESYFPEIGGLDKYNLSSRGGETIAMEELQPWFVKSLAIGDFFEKKIGEAKCSKEDNYCKKTGRELAKSRMKLRKLKVIGLETQGENFTCFLEDDRGNVYELAKYENAKSVFFLGVETRESYNSRFINYDF